MPPGLDTSAVEEGRYGWNMRNQLACSVLLVLRVSTAMSLGGGFVLCAWSSDFGITRTRGSWCAYLSYHKEIVQGRFAYNMAATADSSLSAGRA